MCKSVQIAETSPHREHHAVKLGLSLSSSFSSSGSMGALPKRHTLA